MNKILKKTLSIILTILMIVTTIPMAFAAESDGVKTTLDVSEGNIEIAASYVTLGYKTVEVDPDGYIITGIASGDTPLKFINDSESSITFDLVFDNLSLTANAWCSVMSIKDYLPVTLNIVCEGSNAISSYNHSVFNNDYARTSITINITKTEGSSLTFERQYAPEDGILFNKDDTNTFVYIDGNQVDSAAHASKGIPDCRGYFCDECGQYFGEKDETKHSGDGVQTCCGYKCDVCEGWYGEKDETKHSGDGVQTCCGYKCDVCEGWYGEAADEEHIDKNSDDFCDVTDNFIGEEIKVGDTYVVNREGYVKFVPTVSGIYIISALDGSDTYVDLLDSDFEYIAYSDDDGDGFNFSLKYIYEAGETYYFYFIDFNYVYNYSVSFVCAEHQGGEATCIEKAVCDACGEWYGEADADNHSFTKYEEVTAPECGKAGLEVATCDNGCGATDEQEIPALGHDWSNNDGICAKGCGTECLHESYTKDVCDNCGIVCSHKSYSMGICDKCNCLCPHSFTEFNETVAPKCEETGWEESYCDYCNIRLEQEIPETGHDWVSGGVARPTQNIDGSWSDGYYYDTCKNDVTHINKTGVAKRADYTVFDEAYKALKTEQKNEALTDAGAASVNQAVMAGMTMPQNIIEGESTTAYLNNWVINAQSILAKIESGEYVKADYTEIDEAIKAVDEALENATISEEMKAELEDIKADLAALKENASSTMADVNALLDRAEAITETMNNCANGIHSFTKYEEVTAPECGKAGLEKATCDHGCGAIDEKETEALKHVDEDGDCLCDNGCGTQISDGGDGGTGEPETPDEPADDVCEDCGKVHNGFFSEIICFFTRIINFIKNLFA